MTRGFITIATGKRHYYYIARNLLRAYRHYSEAPLPFAIIAEEENEFTSEFDDVVIVKECFHSFNDKFLLLKHCPYEENIFVDADCLCFGDLNRWWQIFDNATDFSAVGETVSRNSPTGAWYNVEDIGEYGKTLPYKCRVHSGVCFIRKGYKCEKMYDDCLKVYKDFSKLHFHTCPFSVDECILGITMPMNGMTTTKEPGEMLCALPCMKELSADILHCRLSYAPVWGGYYEHGLLLHFGTNQTYQPLYRYNVACLNYLLKHHSNNCCGFMYFLLERKWLLRYYKVIYVTKTFIGRCKNYIVRHI